MLWWKNNKQLPNTNPSNSKALTQKLPASNALEFNGFGFEGFFCFLRQSHSSASDILLLRKANKSGCAACWWLNKDDPKN